LFDSLCLSALQRIRTCDFMTFVVQQGHAAFLSFQLSPKDA